MGILYTQKVRKGKSAGFYGVADPQRADGGTAFVPR